ncbi:MAG: hypothetical protein JWM40_2253, partial [Frankiales bacterium]|nr:hypothetical protein [Frankiales bacterium]
TGQRCGSLTAQPLVSVLLLTYNSRDVIERCLHALDRQTYPNVEVVCVDNASSDSTPDLVRRRAGVSPTVTLTVNASNTGFALGMNQALAASHGDVVVFLNSDCLLEPDFLATAVDLLADHPEADALAATVVRLGGVDAPTERTGRHPLDGAVLGITPALRVQHKEQTHALQPTFKANGACPVLRRSMLDRMAGQFGVPAFDPVFDTYAEDIDFAFRAAASGAITLCSTDLVAWHVRSVSGGGIRVFDKRGRMRTNIVAGRYLNCWRHLPLHRALLTQPFLMAQDLGLVAVAASKGDRTALRDVLAAWRRLLANAGELRRFRRTHRTWRAFPRGSVNAGEPRKEMVVDLSR